jgi:hypothetical protein
VLKTCAEISQIAGVSKQAINKFIIKNKIQPSGMKGKYKTYYIDKEPLSSYLAAASPPAKNQKSPPQAPKTPTTSTPPPSPPQTDEEAVRRISKPLNRFLARQMEPGDKPAEYLFGKALELAQTNQDATLYFKLGQIAVKEENDETIRLQALETEKAREQIARGRADRIRLENEIRRSEYIDKAAIKTLFGRVYAVHTSILTPLSLKLASTLAAIPPGEGKEAAIKKLIDDEVYAALEMIKRQLVEYVSEPVDKPA